MLAAMVMAAALAGPLPAPPVYVTENYTLTFRPPAGVTYCPLPKGWVGSDHGTVLFLVPPERCGGAGYPSNGREFSPNVPRIEVFYGYWDADDMTPPACPQPIGATVLMGQDRPLCRAKADGMETVSVRAEYSNDSPAAVTFTLATTPERFDKDLEILRDMVASARTCQASIPVLDRPPLIWESGKPCPSGRWF